jgi:ABC-2 type transport system permease protein
LFGESLLLVRTLRKWKAVFSVWFQDGLAYRASGIIWIMTDVVTAVTMPLVWAAAAGAGKIAGFTTSDFVLYYLVVLMIGSFVTSHIMWEISMEIKEGQFSTALLRPISYFQYSFFRNLSWRIIRPALFAPFFFILLYLYRGYLGEAHVVFSWEFLASLLLGHMVSFCFVMMMSLIALFVEETTSIFELYYVPLLFLSGQMFPVAVLPEWARQVALFFPFYYTTGLPAEILIGRVSGEQAWQGIGVQVAWMTGCYVVARVLWARGLRYYTAVGM